MSDAIAEHPGPGSPAPDEVHLWSVRLSSISSDAALRKILGGYLDVPAGKVSLTRTPNGKPRLDGCSGPAFNLSHSGTLALIGVSARERVGVDIEQLRGRSRERLLGRVLAAEEAAAVRACAEAERERAFLRHWTAKEACVKARGTGLIADLKALRIIDALGSPVARGLGMDDLSLQRHDPCPEVVGTVAVSGGPWRAVPLKLAADYLG